MKRASATKLASTGSPYLKPKLITFRRRATGPVSLNSSVMAVARPWTFSAEVSSTMSAEVAQFVQQLAFGGDAVEDPAAGLQRVRTPALLEAADQDVVVGVEEQDPERRRRWLPGCAGRRGCPRTAPCCGRRSRRRAWKWNPGRGRRVPRGCRASAGGGSPRRTSRGPRGRPRRCSGRLRTYRSPPAVPPRRA